MTCIFTAIDEQWLYFCCPAIQLDLFHRQAIGPDMRLKSRARSLPPNQHCSGALFPGHLLHRPFA